MAAQVAELERLRKEAVERAAQDAEQALSQVDYERRAEQEQQKGDEQVINELKTELSYVKQLNLQALSNVYVVINWLRD